MPHKLTRRERCEAGRHTPVLAAADAPTEVRRDTCRYCRKPIMRTQATRIWFLTTMLT